MTAFKVTYLASQWRRDLQRGVDLGNWSDGLITRYYLFVTACTRATSIVA